MIALTDASNSLGHVFLFLTLLICAGCGGGSEGACTRGSGVTQTCGDDFTSGQCGIVNGTYRGDGTKCSDIGFGKSPKIEDAEKRLEETLEYDLSQADDGLTELLLTPPEIKAKLGVEQNIIIAVFEAVDRNRMELFELQDLAAREGWINTPKYEAAFQKASDNSTMLRIEFGDQIYDRYLYSISKPNRLVVENVYSGSAADISGLQSGDVILSYAQQRVFSSTELTSATTQGYRDEPVLLEIQRSGEIEYISLPRGPIGIEITAEYMLPD